MISLLIVSVASAVLYRMGGIGKPFNTKVRDMGCAFVCLAWLFFNLKAPWWSYLISFGAMFGALTTYHKWLSRLIYKTENVEWVSWLFTGLVYGLSLFPLALATGNWAGLIYRSIVLAAGTCLWSEGIALDWLEEGGRGLLLGLTLPIMLV